MYDIYIRIKERRNELGLTQQDLAELVGYKGKSMIAKIEKGQVDLQRTMITKFANALNCTESYLMGWNDSPTDKTFDNQDEKKHISIIDYGIYLDKLGEYIYIEKQCPNKERYSKALSLYAKYLNANKTTQMAIDTLLSDSEESEDE